MLIYFVDACKVSSLHFSAYAVPQFVLDGAKSSEAFVFKSHDSCSIYLFNPETQDYGSLKLVLNDCGMRFPQSLNTRLAAAQAIKFGSCMIAPNAK